MIPQLPLALGLRDSAAFESYLPGPNAEALACLRQAAERSGEAALYLWGAPGTGKTHLLQAACRAAGERERAATYLPMQAADQIPSEALDGLENVAVVCIDDIHLVAGREDWEHAVMHLFERSRRAGGNLVVAGRGAPAESGLMAPLASRLASGLMLQLRPLDDEQLVGALQLHARRRGLNLPAETGRYLLRRLGRETHALFDTLASLDRASLAAKRRLTVPFVRAALADPDPPAPP